MTAEKYRVQKITISNFRGITEKRTIDVSGRHLFVFGPNGFGKSTIVEAIRWCLFGSPSGQQDIEVRNTFCPSEISDVVLDLAAQKKTLSMRRHLPPGISQSKPTVSDHEGKVVNIGTAFPQLTRLGQHAGTQVIFAAQHAAGRRQAEISDFSRVLDFYLGIEEMPEMMDKLRKLAEERDAEHEEMSESLDAFLHTLQGELTALQGKRNEILKTPPWGKGPLPTRSETERKIDSLLRETAHLVESEVPSGLSRQERIPRIKKWNETLASGKSQDFKAQLEGHQTRLEKILETKNQWLEEESNITKTREAIAELTRKEQSILNGQTLEALTEELAAEERACDEANLRLSMLRHASIYLDKYQPSSCPLCNQDLVTGKVNHPECTPSASGCQKLETQISDIKKVREETQAKKTYLSSVNNKMEGIVSRARNLIRKHEVSIAALEEHIEGLSITIKTLQSTISDAEAEDSRRDRRIGDLEIEERFHYYQDQEAAIEEILQKDVAGPRSALAEYNNYLATTEEISRLILEAYEEQRDLAIPAVEKELSHTYKRLTGHPSYDGVCILKQPLSQDRIEPGKLDLKVTSSRIPGKSFPSNVLNGQAARALQLVPYFVFSDYWQDVMELDLLLVDDPSESFDTSHLDNLLSVLKSVAAHTQLIVASHETDRMRSLIEKYFPVEERCLVLVEDFDPLKGPTFEQR